MDVIPAGVDRQLGGRACSTRAGFLGVLDPGAGGGPVQALAHITGGGLPENVPTGAARGQDYPRGRARHRGRCRRCSSSSAGAWPPGRNSHELHRTLNMGIGMVVVCAGNDIDAVQASIAEETWVIGELIPGAGEPAVHLV